MDKEMEPEGHYRHTYRIEILELARPRLPLLHTVVDVEGIAL